MGAMPPESTAPPYMQRPTYAYFDVKIHRIMRRAPSGGCVVGGGGGGLGLVIFIFLRYPPAEEMHLLASITRQSWIEGKGASTETESNIYLYHLSYLCAVD